LKSQSWKHAFQLLVCEHDRCCRQLIAYRQLYQIPIVLVPETIKLWFSQWIIEKRLSQLHTASIPVLCWRMAHALKGKMITI
jgi:hypothetical protein